VILKDAFLDQARSNRELGSPFTSRVLTLLAERLDAGNPVIDRMRSWKGDITNRGASLPLRILGGLHALVLSEECPELVAVYPPVNGHPDDEALGAAIDIALQNHQATLMHWLDSAPQTNEVRRSSVIIAAAHWLAAHYGTGDFVVSELGASAGLNLMWEKYRLDLACGVFGPRNSTVRLDPEWRGFCPPEANIKVRDRRGVDIAPLDAHNAEDALRLTSYLWPDQPWRIERARAAIDLCDIEIDKQDASEWLTPRLAEPHPGAIHLVYHTIAWQYFDEATSEKCLAALEEAGARATPDAPLARLSVEGDNRKGEGAPIKLTTWPGGKTIILGRTDFHGRWIDWNAPQHPH
jgi:hypothetical protein